MTSPISWVSRGFVVRCVGINFSERNTTHLVLAPTSSLMTSPISWVSRGFVVRCVGINFSERNTTHSVLAPTSSPKGLGVNPSLLMKGFIGLCQCFQNVLVAGAHPSALKWPNPKLIFSESRWISAFAAFAVRRASCCSSHFAARSA